jgi:hypothetical protein
MIHGLDARQMCGQDIRSRGVWPSDSSRLEAFVGQHGGIVEAYPIGNVGVALRWIDGERSVTRSGPTFADALQSLQASLTGAA